MPDVPGPSPREIGVATMERPAPAIPRPPVTPAPRMELPPIPQVPTASETPRSATIPPPPLDVPETIASQGKLVNIRKTLSGWFSRGNDQPAAQPSMEISETERIAAQDSMARRQQAEAKQRELPAPPLTTPPSEPPLFSSPGSPSEIPQQLPSTPTDQLYKRINADVAPSKYKVHDATPQDRDLLAQSESKALLQRHFSGETLSATEVAQLEPVLAADIRVFHADNYAKRYIIADEAKAEAQATTSVGPIDQSLTEQTRQAQEALKRGETVSLREVPELPFVEPMPTSTPEESVTPEIAHAGQTEVPLTGGMKVKDVMRQAVAAIKEKGTGFFGASSTGAGIGVATAEGLYYAGVIPREAVPAVSGIVGGLGSGLLETAMVRKAIVRSWDKELMKKAANNVDLAITDVCGGDRTKAFFLARELDEAETPSKKEEIIRTMLAQTKGLENASTLPQAMVDKAMASVTSETGWEGVVAREKLRLSAMDKIKAAQGSAAYIAGAMVTGGGTAFAYEKYLGVGRTVEQVAQHSVAEVSGGHFGGAIQSDVLAKQPHVDSAPSAPPVDTPPALPATPEPTPPSAPIEPPPAADAGPQVTDKPMEVHGPVAGQPIVESGDHPLQTVHPVPEQTAAIPPIAAVTNEQETVGLPPIDLSRDDFGKDVTITPSGDIVWKPEGVDATGQASVSVEGKMETMFMEHIIKQEQQHVIDFINKHSSEFNDVGGSTALISEISKPDSKFTMDDGAMARLAELVRKDHQVELSTAYTDIMGTLGQTNDRVPTGTPDQPVQYTLPADKIRSIFANFKL